MSTPNTNDQSQAAVWEVEDQEGHVKAVISSREDMNQANCSEEDAAIQMMERLSSTTVSNNNRFSNGSVPSIFVCDKYYLRSLFSFGNRYSSRIFICRQNTFLCLVLSLALFCAKKISKCLSGKCKSLFLFLSLSWLVGGAVGFCPHGCSCNDVTVDCRQADLEVVPYLLNPRIVSLTLASNKITTLQESLVFYTYLTSLDLSKNRITSLGLKSFQGQEILRSLNLENNTITSLEDNNFYGLSNLRYLSLNDNNLGSIGGGVFKGLDSLETLQLVNNKIKDIDELGFEHLRSIKTINLIRNKLHKVPVSSLANIVSVEELNLCDNQISAIPERAFQHLSNLSYLNLSKNNISSLHRDAFAGLSKLRMLNILDNRLAIVPFASFPPLKQLSSMDLSGNMFTSLPLDFLRELPSLTSLKMERCPRLSSMHQEAFVSGWRLRELSLSQNPRLSTLPPAALAPLLALRTLDLSSCGLEGLQPTQVPMRELTVLDVSGNPLHCNCSLMWLVHVSANNTLAPGNPSCAAPPALYGVPLKDLGSGTCGPVVGPWTIAGCVGVALAGLLTILAFLACRWRKNRSSPPSTVKALQLCPDSSSVDPRTQRDFTSPLNTDVPNMQVYSSPSYYSASAPPIQFTYPCSRQPLHMCPSDCPCIRQSPALRPLLRTPSSTPTSQLRMSNNKSPSLNNQPPHFVEFPPPPSRPPPAVSSQLQPLSHGHHYQYAPYITGGHLQHLPASIRGGNCPPMPVQLLSTEWLYAAANAGGPDDPQHHWYASIDRSSSSAGAGNESSGYWEEDKEMPTASLLSPGHRPPQQPRESGGGHPSDDKRNDSPCTIESNVVPTSYI